MCRIEKHSICVVYTVYIDAIIMLLQFYQNDETQIDINVNVKFQRQKINLFYICLVAWMVTGDKVRDDTQFHLLYTLTHIILQCNAMHKNWNSMLRSTLMNTIFDSFILIVCSFNIILLILV